MAGALNISCMLTLALLAAGCAHGRPAQSSPSLNLIAAAEIAGAEQAGVRDLYELIEQSRAHWLRVRNDPASSIRHVVLVYLDGKALGGVEVLRGYPLSFVTSLRYLDGAQAALLPGPTRRNTYLDAAIVISRAGGVRFPWLLEHGCLADRSAEATLHAHCRSAGASVSACEHQAIVQGDGFRWGLTVAGELDQCQRHDRQALPFHDSSPGRTSSERRQCFEVAHPAVADRVQPAPENVRPACRPAQHRNYGSAASDAQRLHYRYRCAAGGGHSAKSTIPFDGFRAALEVCARSASRWDRAPSNF